MDGHQIDIFPEGCPENIELLPAPAAIDDRPLFGDKGDATLRPDVEAMDVALGAGETAHSLIIRSDALLGRLCPDHVPHPDHGIAFRQAHLDELLLAGAWHP